MEGKGELEVIQKKYVKWSLGLDNCIPDYTVYQESGLDKIRIRLLIECIEAREREKGCKGWMEEREIFYRQNGFSTEGIRERDLRERGGM